MKLAILLTATIKVQVVGGNFNMEERAAMYASTLRYYADRIGKKYPIVFLENSDYDLSGFKKEFDDKLDIEWIQLRPEEKLPFNAQKGKSFNEYLMIKEGVLRSEKLKECTHFLKITGRYAMVNILTMTREIEKRADDKVFMGDIKDTGLYEMIGSKNYGHWGDSRFWVCQVEYYKRAMLDCYLEMNDCAEGKWAEHYLLNMARKYMQDKRFIFRFRNQVLFNGITGMRTSKDLATGKFRQDSLSIRVKCQVRYLMRVLFPDFWF